MEGGGGFVGGALALDAGDEVVVVLGGAADAHEVGAAAGGGEGVEDAGEGAIGDGGDVWSSLRERCCTSYRSGYGECQCENKKEMIHHSCSWGVQGKGESMRAKGRKETILILTTGNGT